jgi:hypothetical protein
MQSTTPSDRPSVRWIIKRDTRVPFPAWNNHIDIRTGLLHVGQRTEHQQRLRFRAYLSRLYNIKLTSEVADARYLRVPSSDKDDSTEERWVHVDRIDDRWGRSMAIIIEATRRVPHAKISFEMCRAGADERRYFDESSIGLT